MTDRKILGKTIEEFMINWNAITFEISGLEDKFAYKLSKVFIDELIKVLNSKGITIQDFFTSMSAGGSMSTKKLVQNPSLSEIKDFYSNNLWGTSIPYTIPIALELEPNLKGKKILDLGCGFGRLSVMCALKGAKVTAVDISTYLINILESISYKLKLNIDCYAKDIENIDFKEKFDVIFLCEVIEHLPNPLFVLKTIHKILKSNGELIISTPNVLNLVGFKQTMLKKLFNYNWISPYGVGQHELYNFTIQKMKKLLLDASFKIDTYRGAELLDNFAILFPSNTAIGITQLFPLFFKSFRPLKRGLIELGKKRFFRNLGLEMFIRALPI